MLSAALNPSSIQQIIAAIRAKQAGIAPDLAGLSFPTGSMPAVQPSVPVPQNLSAAAMPDPLASQVPIPIPIPDMSQFVASPPPVRPTFSPLSIQDSRAYEAANAPYVQPAYVADPMYDNKIDKKVLPWVMIGSIIAQMLAPKESNIGSNIIGGYMGGTKNAADIDYQNKKAEADRKRAFEFEKARVANINLEKRAKAEADKAAAMRDDLRYQDAQDYRSKSLETREDIAKISSEAKTVSYMVKTADDPKLPGQTRASNGKTLYESDPERYARFGPDWQNAVAKLKGTEREKLDAEIDLKGAKTNEIKTLLPYKVQAMVDESGLKQATKQKVMLEVKYMPEKEARAWIDTRRMLDQLANSKALGWAKENRLANFQKWDAARKSVLSQTTELHRAATTAQKQQEALRNDIFKLRGEVEVMEDDRKKNGDKSEFPEGYVREKKDELEIKRKQLKTVQGDVVSLNKSLSGLKAELADLRPPNDGKALTASASKPTKGTTDGVNWTLTPK